MPGISSAVQLLGLLKPSSPATLANSAVNVSHSTKLAHTDLPLGKNPRFTFHKPDLIQRAAFSAIIKVGELVLPLVMLGITLASTTRRPAMRPPRPSRTRR